MDWFVTVIAIVVAVLALSGAIVLGADATDNGWKNDCEALGAHRVKDIVYICHKK